ncbi:MAG: helix-turn-helix domain-containing protein [Terriglobia bacterium]
MDRITTLGQHIRQLREKRDISLRELASRLKVSAAFLSDVELGRRHASDRLLGEIARHLDASVEDLKQHDTRPPVEEIRKLSNADPVYGLAFRKLVNKNLSPEDLLRVAEAASKSPKKRK